MCFAEKGWKVLMNRWYCLLTMHYFGTSTDADLFVFSLENEDGDNSIFSPNSSTLASSGSSFLFFLTNLSSHNLPLGRVLWYVLV